MSEKSKRQFVQWVQENDPFLYQAGVRVDELKNQGLDGFELGNIFTSIVDTIKTTGADLLKLRQQKKMMDLQIKRARAGAPPIQFDNYQPSMPLTPQTQPIVEQVAVKTASGFDTGKLIIPLGIGAFLFLLMKR